MNVVGKVGSLISQGVYSVATPFHPFGGAVDIIVVQQQDGTFRSTPWYVRFGKFQGVLKGAEKMVRISVNGTEADFHMFLDNSGEAYFVREADSGKEDNAVGTYRLEHSVSDTGVRHLKDELESSVSSKMDRCESDLDRRFYDFQDDQSQDGSVDLSDYGSNRYDDLDNEQISESDTNSEVVLLSVDGHVMTAPISAEEQDTRDVELTTPHLHLGPGEGADFCEGNDGFDSGDGFIDELSLSLENVQKMNGAVEAEWQNQETITRGVSITDNEGEVCIQNDSEEAATMIKKEDVFRSCLDIQELARQEESEVSDGADAPLLAKVEVNETSSETDNSEPVQKDTSVCENVGSPSISEKHPEQTDVEVEEGLVGGPVLVETADEDQEGGNSVVECSTGEVIEAETTEASSEERTPHLSSKIEISLCRNELHPGMGTAAASLAFDAHRVSMEEFKNSMASILKNENLVIRYREKYLSWEKAAPVVLGLVAFDLDLPVDFQDTILVEEEETAKPTVDVPPNTSGRRWRLWPSAFRKVKSKTLEHQSSTMSNEDVFLDSLSFSPSFQSEAGTDQSPRTPDQGVRSPHKNLIRTNVPTNEQVASLNLKEGQNVITFSFSTRVLGKQQVDAHIYLWMWNARIVISDVDGTITKSDVLGQFMPLVGKDWTQSGVARLFCAIKENGYQLLFLSARAIVQAYLTRSFLLNLKQDGKALPNGPIVISPDGLFPSLYREVIRRAPHEFKIACLEDIKALFPADYNPFYAGFGNRDTDELSYRKIGIPKGKIFIINPKGEVAISHRIDAKSYTSLHTLVNDMFPPTSLVEQLQEDYNSWNYWKMPLPEIEC